MICRDWPRLVEIFGPPDDRPREATERRPTTTPLWTWSSDSTPQVLAFVRRVRGDYDAMIAQREVFDSWATYFKNNQVSRTDFPLIVGFSNGLILRRYNTLVR
jgi:hypothetical protein